MKTIKRLTVLTGTAVLAGTLLSPSAFAATGVLDGASAGNGRDHGWGNCGQNNGGQDKLLGQQLGTQYGMGGYKPGDTCPPVAAKVTTTAPAVPTTGTTTGTSTEDASAPVAPVNTDMTDSLGTIDSTYA